jgi:DNA topoisomerase VI subunit B
MKIFEWFNTDNALRSMRVPGDNQEALDTLYATVPEKPRLTKKHPAKSNKPDHLQPVIFSNAIKLETVRNMLFLEFHAVNGQSDRQLLEKLEPQAKVAMENETVKQLLVTLADLFDCDLKPRANR